MHKTLLISIATLLTLAGCSKNNSSNNQTSASVTGKWTITADTLREYDNGTLDETNGESVSSIDYFQFNSDGSGSTNDGEDTVVVVNYTYKLNGQVINFDYPAQMGADAYAQTATIKQLTANKLILFFDDKYNDQGSTIEDAETVYLTK